MQRLYVFLRCNRTHPRARRVGAVTSAPQVLEVCDARRQPGIERVVGIGQRGGRAILFVDEIHQIAAGRLQEKRLAPSVRKNPFDGGGFVLERKIFN